MTLREFLDYIGDAPGLAIAFLILIPFTALIAMVLGKGEGHIAPWKYLYSVLIYLICIPGIFGIALSIYLFLFEKQSIFDMDMYTQVFPVISMGATLLLIGKNVSLDKIPGFGKMGGLIMMIISIFAIMWFLDRVRLFVFSYMPIQYLLLIFLVILVVVRISWSKMFSSSK